MSKETINREVDIYLKNELEINERKQYWRKTISGLIIKRLQAISVETHISLLKPFIKEIHNAEFEYSLVRNNDLTELGRLDGELILNSIVFSETHDGNVAVSFYIWSPTQESTISYGIFEPKHPNVLDYDELISNIVVEFVKELKPQADELMIL